MIGCGTLDEHIDYFKQQAEKRSQARHANEDRMQDSYKKHLKVSVFGWAVHVEQGLLSPEVISTALLTHHMRRASDTHGAQLYVCGDVAKPSLVQEWVATLSGAMIASPCFFCSGGKKGCSKMYQSKLCIA